MPYTLGSAADFTILSSKSINVTNNNDVKNGSNASNIGTESEPNITSEDKITPEPNYEINNEKYDNAINDLI